MRILAILTAYNEMKYMPLKVQWCKNNGLDLYVIDNMSTDGTWEWLQENGIKSHRFDTDDSFDLRLLQDEIIRTLHVEKPDWVIYCGVDLFYSLSPINTLKDEIELIAESGFNLISMPFISMFNTGEKSDKFDPFNTYYYCKYISDLVMIHKYHSNVSYNADNVMIPHPQIYHSNGLMVNFGQTKNKEEREETLKRREKAWKNGLKNNYGNHYRKGRISNWCWDKESLLDVRNSKFLHHFEKMQDDCIMKGMVK